MSDLVEQMRRHVASYRADNISRHRQQCLDMCDRIEELEAREKRLREALEKVRDGQEDSDHYRNNTAWWLRDIAHKALRK